MFGWEYFPRWLVLFFILGSAEIRSPRPPHIKFRIGQVIRHKRFGYRGVIIGWDAVAKVSGRNVMHYVNCEKAHFSAIFGIFTIMAGEITD